MLVEYQYNQEIHVVVLKPFPCVHLLLRVTLCHRIRCFILAQNMYNFSGVSVHQEYTTVPSLL